MLDRSHKKGGVKKIDKKKHSLNIKIDAELYDWMVKNKEQTGLTIQSQTEAFLRYAIKKNLITEVIAKDPDI